jgi:ribose transport system permease protein
MISAHDLGIRGIDLSVPWTITTAAIMVGTLGSAHGLPVAIAAALAVCLLVGLVNGIGVTFLGLSPIIMQQVVFGIVLLAAIAIPRLRGASLEQ